MAERSRVRDRRAVNEPNIDTCGRRYHRMDQPELTDSWPDRPLTIAEAKGLHKTTCSLSGVMDHEENVWGSVVPGPDDNSVVDVALETNLGLDMYSSTRGRWMDYRTQREDDPDSPSMKGTPASYRVLTGESTALTG